MARTYTTTCFNVWHSSLALVASQHHQWVCCWAHPTGTQQPATWLPQHDDDDDDQHQLRSPDDVVLHWQQVVHHCLVSPLMDDWSHRVHGAVQDEQVTALAGRQASTALEHQGTIIDLQDR